MQRSGSMAATGSRLTAGASRNSAARLRPPGVGTAREGSPDGM